MTFPTFNELSQNKFNRYEIALATAKCARLVTNEYVHQRTVAEKSQSGNNKENDKPIHTMIDKELRDEKAVKVAVNRLYEHKYVITEMSPEEQAKEEQTILKGSLIDDPTEEDVRDTDDDDDVDDGNVPTDDADGIEDGDGESDASADDAVASDETDTEVSES